MCDENFLADVEKATPATVELPNEMSVTARKRGIAVLEVREPKTAFCRAY